MSALAWWVDECGGGADVSTVAAAAAAQHL